MLHFVGDRERRLLPGERIEVATLTVRPGVKATRQDSYEAP